MDERQPHVASDRECFDYVEGLQKAGVLIAAEALQPVKSALTVRVRNGRLAVTDGPFAETKEQLAGYYILDCRNLDEAIEWAAKIPTACQGGSGCIEIRPLGELPAR
jgi:hypothetical protein